MNVALGMSPSFSLLRIDLISDSVETQTKLKMSKSCVLSCLVLSCLVLSCLVSCAGFDEREKIKAKSQKAQFDYFSFHLIY